MAAESNLPAVRVVGLPRVTDERGNLTFVESELHVPFVIRRVYYIYDVPGGAVRGAHAHRVDESVLIAASGSFRVNLSDGIEARSFYLNRSYTGLYVPSMIWRSLDDFSTGSVCLVLTSNPYSAADYYRDYDQYLAARGLAC